MARCGHAPMLTAVPVGRFGVQNPEIPVQVDLDTGAVGPGDQHAVGGGAFAGLGLDFSGGAARDRLHRGGRSNSRLPTTLNARDQPPAEVSDQRVSGLTGAVHLAAHRQIPLVR